MKKAFFSILFAALGLLAASGQTLKNLPIVAVAQIQELSDRTRELGLGRIVAVMARTEMDRSLVLRGAVLEDSGEKVLAEARAAFAPRDPAAVFVLEGAVALLGEAITVDLWATDALTGLRADSASLQVPSLGQLRGAVAAQVARMGTALFRGSLGTLTVSSTPPDCAVFLDDRYVGQTGKDGRLEIPALLPGPYALRVTAPGCLEYASVLSVQARRTAAITASLALEPGSLVIASEPAGASVTLDSRPMGTAPVRIPSVSAGDHKIGVLLDGYVPWERRVAVGSQEEVALEAKLELLRGSLRVESVPPGAAVAAAGRSLGITPLQVYEMEPGPYLLEISLAGYDTQTVSARIDRGKESVNSVTLRKQRGYATVHSSPEGAIAALVTAQGPVELGSTPLEKVELEIGVYTLKIGKDGFHPEERRVEVAAGKVSVVETALRAVPGSIRIGTEPGYAEVLLDGRSRGISPIEIAGLAPGTYTVAVRTAFGSAEKKVTVRPGRVEECALSVPRPALLFVPAALLTLLSILFGLSVFGG